MLLTHIQSHNLFAHMCALNGTRPLRSVSCQGCRDFLKFDCSSQNENDRVSPIFNGVSTCLSLLFIYRKSWGMVLDHRA